MSKQIRHCGCGELAEWRISYCKKLLGEDWPDGPVTVSYSCHHHIARMLSKELENTVYAIKLNQD